MAHIIIWMSFCGLGELVVTACDISFCRIICIMYHDSTSTKVIVVAMQQILGCNVG